MNLKKGLAFATALMMTVSLAACGEPAPASSGAASTAASTAASNAAGGKVEGLKAPIAEQPILLTSVGQSADVEMVNTLFSKAGITPKMEKVATPEQLGDAKTLVLAVGGSSKGLGAAGIDADQELDRVTKLVAAAKEKKLTIIAIHSGGAARRGELSDKFVKPAFENADYAIVVADGDKDGLMAGIASSKGIPMDVVDTMTGIPDLVKAAFK